MSAEIAVSRDSKDNGWYLALHTQTGTKMAFLGGDNNLQVVLGSLKPTVKCDRSSPGPAFLSCSDILAKMDTSKENVTFGRRAGPGVERTLPAYLLSSKAPCPFSNLSEPALG